MRHDKYLERDEEPQVRSKTMYRRIQGQTVVVALDSQSQSGIELPSNLFCPLQVKLREKKKGASGAAGRSYQVFQIFPIAQNTVQPCLGNREDVLMGASVKCKADMSHWYPLVCILCWSHLLSLWPQWVEAEGLELDSHPLL